MQQSHMCAICREGFQVTEGAYLPGSNVERVAAGVVVADPGQGALPLQQRERAFRFALLDPLHQPLCHVPCQARTRVSRTSLDFTNITCLAGIASNSQSSGDNNWWLKLNFKQN